jgi:pteridine reductase
MQLRDKVVMITGGRRVGGHLARAVAERGAHVAMSYLTSAAKIDATLQDVRESGVRGVSAKADLRDPADVDRLVRTVTDELGRIDVLVNMTSTFTPTPFDSLTPGDLERELASNLVAPYLTAVAVARQMRRQPIVDGIQGKIVNFADWGVERPYKNFLPYFVAKGGVATMTLALAVELAPTIAVNAIAPAMIDPPPELTPDDIEAIRMASPLQRIGCPADAVNAVLYLLEGTDFVTGSTIRVDGGRFLGATHDE